MSVSLFVGQAESAVRVFTQEHFTRFAALSGDDNPIHVDPQFAARSAFGRTVAHGMFLYGVVCGLLGTRLPGPGTMQLEQELMFPSPTFAGEEVAVQVEVAAADPRRGLAELLTTIRRPGGEFGLQGRTRVRLPGAGWDGEPGRSSGPIEDVGSASAFKGLHVGQQARTVRAFTAQDLSEYADLTGDENPLFNDPTFAHRAGFDDALVPGSLLGGLFSYLLGTRLPGQGTNYLKQRLRFVAPTYPGQEIGAVVTVTRLRPEKELVNLSTVCTGPAGDVVCEGEALVRVADVQAG